jgi:hypothetical protein
MKPFATFSAIHRFATFHAQGRSFSFLQDRRYPMRTTFIEGQLVWPEGVRLEPWGDTSYLAVRISSACIG